MSALFALNPLKASYPRRMISTASDGFYLPKLNYNYDALEPYIDTQTMQIHHDNHHNTYVQKLNSALKDRGELSKMSLVDLQTIAFKEGGAVRNHGGGHYNHTFFWTILQPKKQVVVAPSNKLHEYIDTSFGSYDNMTTKFTDSALAVFGSGFTWLVYVPNLNKLDIVNTINQDNPLMDGIFSNINIPILCLDVWEHAYYLKHQYKRGEYINSWWNVVNWDQVSFYFENYALKGQYVPVEG
eukprot:GHVR01117184.1.p1 GENE.GHVR01117184.1~~GHVR01117184.1.p1  ORF type:complete len:252 (+),score=52.75 GHVR01117184.1:36-758(+)